LIEHQHNGYLFKANDADDLAATVLGLLNQPQQWEQKRVAGRLYVEQDRNWAKSVSFYKSIYAQLITRS
jgi:glycosyltransferase involved in cell wall biosynthesis